MRAGQIYLDALFSLGLTPAYLGWGWDEHNREWVLALVTSIVDAGGPLALNKLLFRAYNAQITPREISPFIVRIFSPDLIEGGLNSTFWLLGDKDLTVKGVAGRRKSPVAAINEVTVENVEMDLFGLHLEMINSYSTKPGAVQKAFGNYHAQRRDWLGFRKNVERAAA